MFHTLYLRYAMFHDMDDSSTVETFFSPQDIISSSPVLHKRVPRRNASLGVGSSFASFGVGSSFGVGWRVRMPGTKRPGPTLMPVEEGEPSPGSQSSGGKKESSSADAALGACSGTSCSIGTERTQAAPARGQQEAPADRALEPGWSRGAPKQETSAGEEKTLLFGEADASSKEAVV